MNPAPESVSPADLPASSAIRLAPCWERWAVRAILLIFLIIELNNIRNLAYDGQDFDFHVLCTQDVMEHPGHWIQLAVTNRPLAYWIGGACDHFTHGKYTYELASFIFVLLALPALWLFHDSTRGIIVSPLLRIAALAFVAFLPVTLITSVVYASDTLALLPFAVICWSLSRCVQAMSGRAAAGYLLLAGFTLSAGNLVKFTFILVPLAVLVCITILRRWGGLSWRRWSCLLALAVVGPTLLGGWLFVKSRSELADQPDRHAFDWNGTGEMTWGSVLGLKGSDARILKAPGYWDNEVVDGHPTLPLLKNNSYSYPALLHLAVFTDVMDFANAGATDNGARRPQPQRRFSRWAVQGGLFFSIPILLTSLAFCVQAVRALFRPKLAPPAILWVWMSLSLAWYLPLVVVLPYVHNSYGGGYWLPRLVLPALWGFILVFFAMVDRLIGQRPWAVIVVAIAVLLQTAVQIRSIWY
jgi:4-amino-4-deoxy-L-arabinose transferase-like glycosyltransferase